MKSETIRKFANYVLSNIDEKESKVPGGGGSHSYGGLGDYKSIRDKIMQDVVPDVKKKSEDFDKIAARKIIEKHNIEILIVDFSKDKDEPAYDVEVWINGKPTMGGKDKQIFGIGTEHPSYQYPTKEKALTAAKERVQEILKEVESK